MAFFLCSIYKNGPLSANFSGMALFVKNGRFFFAWVSLSLFLFLSLLLGMFLMCLSLLSLSEKNESVVSSFGELKSTLQMHCFPRCGKGSPLRYNHDRLCSLLCSSNSGPLWRRTCNPEGKWQPKAKSGD
jgi:hypothetical protein